jgi:hypothetical protein
MKSSKIGIIIFCLAFIVFAIGTYFRMNKSYSYIEDFMCTTFTSNKYVYIEPGICCTGCSGTEDYWSYKCTKPRQCG